MITAAGQRNRAALAVLAGACLLAGCAGKTGSLAGQAGSRLSHAEQAHPVTVTPSPTPSPSVSPSVTVTGQVKVTRDPVWCLAVLGIQSGAAPRVAACASTPKQEWVITRTGNTVQLRTQATARGLCLGAAVPGSRYVVLVKCSSPGAALTVHPMIADRTYAVMSGDLYLSVTVNLGGAKKTHLYPVSWSAPSAGLSLNWLFPS